MGAVLQTAKAGWSTSLITDQIEDTISTLTGMLTDSDLIVQIGIIAELIINAYRCGKKLLIAGNGGSAADAQHLAGELVSRFFFERDALPALALTTDTSILTAIGNDYGYEQLFSRQIQAHASPGDIFLGISTSGNSANILQAFSACHEKGVTTIGLTGQNGGKMPDYCNYCIKIPAILTPRIQEAHILVGHILCSMVEMALFGDER